MAVPGAAAHIAVIGGGFSGAAFAIQAARSAVALACGVADDRSGGPLRRIGSITVIEPRAQLGGGIAYSSDDPDHRLNAPSLAHFARPDDPGGFHRWWLQSVGAIRDPQAVTVAGLIFARRADFGRFMRSELALCAPLIRHRRASAVGLSLCARRSGAAEPSFSLALSEGEPIAADLVVVATGIAPPRVPWPPWPPGSSGSPGLPGSPGHTAASPNLIESPWDLGRIRSLQRDARVLLLGSGLTSFDVMATLLGAGHRGALVSLSRHGLRPQPLPPSLAMAAEPSSSGSPVTIWERLQQPTAPFLHFDRSDRRARQLLRRLRQQIAISVAAGASWYEPFDDLRDALSRIWLQLSQRDQMQLLRHLRGWYDSHRFRLPPQTEAIINSACRRGQVHFRAGRMHSLRQTVNGFELQLRERHVHEQHGQPTIEHFDAIVNCTGPSAAADVGNPFLASLLQQGLAQCCGNGVGLAVDEQCRMLDTNGRSQVNLLAIGPPSAGSLADPIGAVFISAHIHRVLRCLIETAVVATDDARIGTR